MRQKVSRGDSNGDSGGTFENEKTPSEEGVSSFLVTDFQEESVDVSYGGGGKEGCLKLHASQMVVWKPVAASSLGCLGTVFRAYQISQAP